jgi:hypothetical protein
MRLDVPSPAPRSPGPWQPDLLPLRVARTGLLGLAAAVLAAVGHTAAGGARPAPALVLAAGLLAAGACWRASRRRLGAVRCATVTAGVQAFSHLAFAVTTPAGVPVHTGDGVAMIAAHAVAGAAFGVWLAVGEAALWRAAARLAAATAVAVRHLARRVDRLLAAAPAPAPGRPGGLGGPRRLRPARRPPLRHAVVRRGPPVAVAGAPG